MRLDEGAHVVDGGLPVHGEIALPELLGDPRAGHVHADDAPGLAVRALLGDHLHQAVRVTDDERAAVADVAVLGHDDVDARVLGRLLGHADERDLGVAVDAPRDLRVVERDRVLAEDRLHRAREVAGGGAVLARSGTQGASYVDLRIPERPVAGGFQPRTALVSGSTIG